MEISLGWQSINCLLCLVLLWCIDSDGFWEIKYFFWHLNESHTFCFVLKVSCIKVKCGYIHKDRVQCWITYTFYIWEDNKSIAIASRLKVYCLAATSKTVHLFFFVSRKLNFLTQLGIKIRHTYLFTKSQDIFVGRSFR